MSPNFSLSRLAILIACLLVFLFMGGFSSAVIDIRAWSRLFTLFMIGAVSVSVIDHQVGVVDPSNLRGIYVVFGVLLMVAAGLWLNALKAGL